jgi:hypothetical protein
MKMKNAKCPRCQSDKTTAVRCIEARRVGGSVFYVLDRYMTRQGVADVQERVQSAYPKYQPSEIEYIDMGVSHHACDNCDKAWRA